MPDTPIDYSRIDPGIRNIVYLLNNNVPFTTSGPEGMGGSCEGHLEDRVGLTGAIPDRDHKFLMQGDLLFKVDKSHPRAQDFLFEVNKLKARYHFVEFYEHHCGNEDCQIEDWQILYLRHFDLTHPEQIQDNDPIEIMIKKRHQVRIDMGEKRIEEFKQVWTDFLAVIQKYVEGNPKPPFSN